MMNDKIAQIKTFVNENVTNDVLKKVGISATILFVVIVAQLIIHEVVMVVDAIPVFNGIMQLVGLFTLINFVRNNLLTPEQRQEFVGKVQNTYNDIVK